MEENKLIAEFWGMVSEDGGEMYYDDDENLFPPTSKDKLKFHESWDWLMPVVEKIEDLGFTTSIKTRYVRINPIEMPRYDNYISWISFYENNWHSKTPCPYLDDNLDAGYELTGNETLSKKQAIYKAVVRFIKWYNKNK